MSGLSNAQAALQAAATMYTGTTTHPDTVAGVAGVYKRWLDKQDRDDQQVWRRPEPAPKVQTTPGLPGPRPTPAGPPVAHGVHPDLGPFAVYQMPSSKGHPDNVEN